MAKLIIDCPNTGKPVFTGIDLPKSTLESTTLENNTTDCPHLDCPEDTHTWDKEDAYLEGEG